MTKAEKLSEELKKLAKENPELACEMPKNPVGLPTGIFLVAKVLNYLADCILQEID